MEQMSFAQAVARLLAAWGVKFIFGVAGNDILPFLDALAREGSIRYIGTAHEAGAAWMAAYLARLTGAPGVCVASAAGTVNLAQGLADACLEKVPVLALTGQVATGKIGTRAGQYFNHQGLLGSFATSTELVTEAPAGLGLLVRALSQAKLMDTVAHLSIPENIWTIPVEATPCTMPALVGTRMHCGYILGDIERVGNLMHQARRPLLVVGVRDKSAFPEIRQLAATWGAGVIIAQEAKGVLPDTMPRVIGGIGEAWLPPLVGESDCVLLIGSAPFEKKFLPRMPVIQVETFPWLVDENYLWDSLAGDIPSILRDLTGKLQGYQPDPGWQEGIAAAIKERQEIINADSRNKDQPLHPARLMAALNNVVAKDAIVAVDIGAFNHWFDRDFLATEQKILLSSRWRSMGYALPAAVAAALCCPDKKVIALTGDGGLLMSPGELTTAVKYRLPITVIVVNNSSYALEKDKALAAHLQPPGLEVPAPDFCQYANACGARGFRVEDPASLETTLDQAIDLPEPALVDVICQDVRLPRMDGP